MNQHLNQPEFLATRCPNELLEPRPRARHDQGAFVEGQNLAKGIVATHGDNGCGIGNERFGMAVEGNRVDVGQSCNACVERGLQFGIEKRSEDEKPGEAGSGIKNTFNATGQKLIKDYPAVKTTIEAAKPIFEKGKGYLPEPGKWNITKEGIATGALSMIVLGGIINKIWPKP